MFSYYGGKKKLAALYPPPKHNIIIEPFAGAAWYSTLYRDKLIFLNEKYDKLYTLWRWLIEESTREDLLEHSRFYAGDTIDRLDIADGHKYLLGYLINRGSAQPKKTVTKWAAQAKGNFASTVYYNLQEIASIVDSIRHWNVMYGDYRDIPNVEATWFIDPPYQSGGQYYAVGNKDINYNELADWCQSRKGQVIVCENKAADWLPFKPFATMNGQRKMTMEVIWTNNDFAPLMQKQLM